MGKNNFILIGFMGSGKSSVGKQLAKRIGYEFMDTDEMIVPREGMEIQEIFSRYGEEMFRNIETTLLTSLMDTIEKTVLSTGGGMPIRDKNVNLLRAMGQVIYLKASKDTIINRLSGDTSRPLLNGENIEAKVEKLLSAREPIYERSADTIIDTDDKSIDDIIEDILGGKNY